MHELKQSKGYKTDTDLTADDLKKLCEQFKAKVKEVLGQPFPDEPHGAAVGRHRRGVQELERQAGHLLPQDRRHSRRVGHRVQRAGAWSSATWATPPPPAWPSAATRPPARTSSTANGWSTPRAKTSWPASARPTPSTKPPRTSRTSTCLRCKPSMPELYKRARRHPQQARTPLPRHAGHRVHDPGRQALHAPVPQRQADRHRGLEHGHGHARTRADRREDGRDAGQPAQLDELLHPIVDPGAEKKPRRRSGLPAGPGRARAARSCSPRPRPWTGRSAGQDGDPGPRRDQSRGRGRHARGRGHPHRPRRHDQPRGVGGPRLGQVLHRGGRRA